MSYMNLVVAIFEILMPLIAKNSRNLFKGLYIRDYLSEKYTISIKAKKWQIYLQDCFVLGWVGSSLTHWDVFAKF